MTLEDKEMDYLQSIFDAFEANPDECNIWESSFMRDNQKRFQDFGAELHLSEKQWAIIRAVGTNAYGIHEPGSQAEEYKEHANSMKKPTDVDDDSVPF